MSCFFSLKICSFPPHSLTAVHQQVMPAASHCFARDQVSQRWLPTHAIELTLSFSIFFIFFPECGMKYWSKAFRNKQKFKGKPFIRVSQYGCMATESFSALTLKNKLYVMVKSAQLWWLTQTQHLFRVFAICCFLHNSCFTLQCSRLQKEGVGEGRRVNKTHD